MAVGSGQGDYVLAFTSAGYLSLVAAGMVLAITRGAPRKEPPRVVAVSPATATGGN